MIAEQMASALGLPMSFVETMARTASHQYKAYYVPKRSGGVRLIHHPSKRLKALQRWLLQSVIARLPVHPAAMAYRPGRSIVHNARPHAESRYLLRMDFAEFFESITETDLRSYIRSRSQLFALWTAVDVELFIRLVCRSGKLTIGAPTSPALSNAICYDLDVAIDALAGRSAVTYTRYADDLFFSCIVPGLLSDVERDVTRLVGGLAIPAALRVNTAKTRHASRRGRRRVTGITLGSDGQVHVGRATKRRIRALIHRYPTLDRQRQISLAGLVAFAIDVEPDFMNSLISKYGLEMMNRVRAAGRH